MRHLFIMVVAGLCYLFLLPSTGQAQELNDCSVLQDISESPYKEDICALYSQGIMSANNGSAFNPSANVTLKEEIDIILKGLNLYTIAGQFVGGVCPNDPYMSYAINKKLISSTTCPNGAARRRLSSVTADTGNALIKMGSEPLNHFWEYSTNYFGPASFLLPASPFGISKNYFKYAYGVNALPDFNPDADPALNTYGLQYLTRGQLAWIINRGLVKRDITIQIPNYALYVADATNRAQLKTPYAVNSPMPRGDAIGIAMRLMKLAGLINYPDTVTNPFINVPDDYEYLPELVEARTRNIITASQGTFTGEAGTWIFDYNKYVSRRTMAAWLYYIARLDTNLKNRYDALYTQYRASTTFDPTDTGATASLKLAIITLRMDALPLATQNAAGQYNTRFTFIPEAEESILTIYKMLGIEPQPQPEPLPETNNFCPAYTQSELLAARPRANQIIINPSANSNDYQWLISISQAGPDTEVLLRDGIYYFPGAYDLPYNQMQIHSNVTVRSFSGNRDNVVIRGKGYDVGSEGFLVTGQNVDIADLSITNMRNHGIAIKGELGAEATHIYNVSMYDIGTQFIKGAPDAQDGSNNNLIACSSFGYSALDKIKGDYIAAIDLHRFHNTHIRDNTIYNFMGDGSGCEVDISCGTYVTHPAVLIWNQSSGTILERNVFTNNFRSIALGLTSGHTGGIIRNNFIYRSLDGDAGIELQTATGTRVYNNTVRIAGYNGAIEARQSSNLDIRNNLLSSPFYDRGGLTGVTLANNISNATDTDFISADSPHIVDGSRLIGAGVVLADVTADFDGDLRNGSNDIGADQWSSSGTSPQPPQPLPTPVESTLVLSNAEDTWLGSNAEESAASFGGDTILQTYSTVSAGGNARVSLLKFDLSQIPAGATITDAKIEFYVQSIDYPSSPSVIIHRVSQNWLEGTDTGAWDNQPVDGANWASRGPGIGNWSSAGGSIAEPLCQLTLVNLSMNSCTVTSLVQQWLNGSTANNGIRIANTNEYNDVVSISSSESANAANRPRLVVQYTSGTAPQVQNDSDGDGISDSVDNCPLIANANQADSDADNLGNACDPTPNGDDIDHDGVADSLDNCPQIANSDQGNLDNDSLGNACDPDDDNDGIIDSSDNCPYNSNANQSDRDGDGLGDICDPTPDSNPPDQNGNSDNLRETKLQRIATRVATFTQNATLAQPTNFVAVNRNGQTFLTWTENSAITGEKYVIYRSTNPINADTLGQATPIALIAENSSYYRTEAIRDGSVQQRFIIENNGAQLAATTGLFVNTPHEAGNFYYAIATNSGAQANLTSFANSNSLANSINETTDDPKPILVATAQSNGRTGRIYTQFMDYHNWNETMHGYAYNYSVSVDDNYNPASNESMQIALHMEGKNSRYANVEIYGDGIWIRIDSPYFASYSEQGGERLVLGLQLQ